MQNFKKKGNSLKILAPAGDWQCLRAAINAGADEIYFGIEGLNMRSTAAKNFTIQDISKISSLCKKNSIKTYVTLNTVMYDSDLPIMHNIVKHCAKDKINGVIASDMATIEYANKKDISVCISTQLSISNIQSVKFYSKYADRIILARELSLEQIQEITSTIKKEKILGRSGNLLEVEIFGHGALCVAISGRCNMSLYCYNSSANRGECTQVCRRKYRVIDNDTKQEFILDNNYVMSPKDLCTIGMLPELIQAGINVLKIEGRGRPAEYVDTVIKSYKKALNAIEDDTYNKNLTQNINKYLELVFNRGLHTGMYHGRSIDEWAQGGGNQAKIEKIFVGKVKHFFSKKQIAIIFVQTNVKIKRNEEIIVVGDKTGIVKFQAKKMIINNKIVTKVVQNDEFTVQTPSTVRKNDEVYILRRM